MPWTARLQEAWVPGYKAKAGGQPCPAGQGRAGLAETRGAARGQAASSRCAGHWHSGPLLGRPPARQPRIHPPQCRVCARVRQLPLRAPCRRLPGEASGPGHRAAQGPLGLSVPRKREGMPSQENPPPHTHTALPSQLPPPSQQAPGSPGLSLTPLGDAALQGDAC